MEIETEIPHARQPFEMRAVPHHGLLRCSQVKYLSCDRRTISSLHTCNSLLFSKKTRTFLSRWDLCGFLSKPKHKNDRGS
jgi:hypothetical protein